MRARGYLLFAFGALLVVAAACGDDDEGGGNTNNPADGGKNDSSSASSDATTNPPKGDAASDGSAPLTPLCEDEWCWVSSSPQGDTIVGVWLGAEGAGLGITRLGNVVRRANSNAAWAVEVPPPAAFADVSTFEGLWGSSGDDLWAVGLKDKFFHYDGRAWTAVTVPAAAGTSVYNAIWGSSRGDIWAVSRGNDVLHYNGSSWTRWATPPDRGARTFSPVWLGGTNKNNVWMCGVYDAEPECSRFDGTNWSKLKFAARPGTPNGAWAAADNTVHVGTGEGVFHYDGGTWAPTSIRDAGTVVHALGGPPDQGFAIQNNGNVYRHVPDAGWSAAGTSFRAPYTIVNGPGVTALAAGGHGGLFELGADGGFSASKSFSNLTTNTIIQVSAVSEREAWARTMNGLLRTRDGDTWQAVDGPGVPGSNLSCLIPFAGGKAWGIYLGKPYLFDGATWTLKDTLSDSGAKEFQTLEDCSATSEQDIWVTSGKAIWHWDGLVWTFKELDIDFLAGIHARTPSDIWLVGRKGNNPVLFHSTSGMSFTAVDFGFDASALSANRVYAASADDIWVTGTNVLFHRTAAGWVDLSATVADEFSVGEVGGTPGNISIIYGTDSGPHVARFTDRLELGPRIRASVFTLAVAGKRRWIGGAEGVLLRSDR